MTHQANNPQLKSWINVSSESHFPIQNLPIGIFSSPTLTPRAGFAIGNYVLDARALAELGYFKLIGAPLEQAFGRHVLNDYMEMGRPVWQAVRLRVSELLHHDNPELRDNSEDRESVLVPMAACQMHLPVHIGNYTDFYSGIQHAMNAGAMFRAAENALLPNYRHLPVAYHGRASSIVVSGTPITRPYGQFIPKDAQTPVFAPTEKLDFELETAFIVGTGNNLGTRIGVDNAHEHIFGVVLFNDWSARDIQFWENRPLGPFLSKSFASSISPWVVSLDALEPFKVASTFEQEPQPLAYLQQKGVNHYNVTLQASLKTASGSNNLLTATNMHNLYWSMAQQLAHHTSNGCNMQPGDVCASGTISGTDINSRGSLLELSWLGKNPLTLQNGESRSFLHDGDTVTITGYAQGEGYKIGFGEVSGTILPAMQ